MFELTGKYNTATIFNDNVEVEAQSQIIELLNQEFVNNSKIRIMPDCHAGAGCVIGTTMTITDRVVPNLVGVDIGCGVAVADLGKVDINLEQLDNFIRNNIPSGHDVHNSETKFELIDNLRCLNHINRNRALCSLGTLGGGNHFIEVNVDNNSRLYLAIHSGSRYLGKQIAEYYQELGYKALQNNTDQIKKVIAELKAAGHTSEIDQEIKKIKKPTVPKHLAYVEGKNYSDYLNDIDIAQQYAYQNRQAMLSAICDYLKVTPESTFQTIHNYIEVNAGVLRKGAIAAYKDQTVIIPMNMRDGSLICRGKGNVNWNCSAPHGAGRLMSRSKAKANVTMIEYQESMSGIFTTSVNQSTIDESPMAYKPMQEIIDNIEDTVDIINIIKPIYNFKAGE